MIIFRVDISIQVGKRTGQISEGEGGLEVGANCLFLKSRLVKFIPINFNKQASSSSS